MKAAFLTLGCKVNQYETQAIKELFEADGFEIVEPEKRADVLVINSCTVTQFGAKKTRQALRHFKQQNPSSITVLTGCYPQAYPEVQSQIPEADVITGTKNRAELLSLVKTAMSEKKRRVVLSPYSTNFSFEPMKVHAFNEKTRAFVKIEDGCARYCSYCVIPKARGPVRSKSLDSIREEVASLAEHGHKEIVLVGINLSSYGKDLPCASLLDAIDAACSVQGIKRIRLGSLEPDLLTKEEIFALAENPKFCPQFHLSLQSGCDQTLKRMNRRYTTNEFRERVEEIRNAFRNPSITTDVIVGFAGETEEEFKTSCQFIKEIGFARIHIFPYSVRPGTAAAKFPNHCTHKTKKERVKILSQIADEAKVYFYKKQENTIQEVLFETEKEGIFQGYTKNYTPVFVPSHEDLSSQIRKVLLTGFNQVGCTGVLQQEKITEQPNCFI